MITVRPARADHLEAIAEIFSACWSISYAKIMPPELVARMTPQSARETWARVWDDPALTVLVAVDGSDVVAVASFSLPSTTEGYLASLYVDPRRQGGGAGRLLLAEVERLMRERGATRARLWVFTDNAPSVGFYRRGGWAEDGVRTTLPEWGQSQSQMVKSLTAEGASA